MFKFLGLLMLGSSLYAANLLTPRLAVDAEVRPFLNQYEQSLKTDCRKASLPYQLSIHLKDFSDLQAGTTHHTNFGCEISFDRGYWYQQNDAWHLEAVAHELTHCVFHEGHSANAESFMAVAPKNHSTKELARQLKQYFSWQKQCKT